MDIKYLLAQNFKVVNYKKGRIIYQPGSLPKAVYFIKSGMVKMVTVNNDGDEFIQGIFKENEYFGEPAMLLDQPYLAYTIAMQDAEIIPVNKHNFSRLYECNPGFCLNLVLTLSRRLYYKSMMLEELANEAADHRVDTLLSYLLKDVESGSELKITRQQIAAMSGLRVETVIRVIKKLSLKQSFKLVRGKIVKL